MLESPQDHSVRAGFTLTELLVVIGIMVMLLALALPVATSLREGNRMMSCRSHLSQISQAIKMYRMDEGGVPPYYIDPDEPYSVDEEGVETNPPEGPGLMQLYYGGYLARRESLHCPRDVYAEPDSEEYFQSYIRRDEDVASDTELNRYTYLSTRGVTDRDDPYYYRQLQPAEERAVSPRPVMDPHWHPSDQTVVTWCSYHVTHVEMGGAGQYNVLFWDGSVRRIGEHLMRDEEVGPGAAWRVGYTPEPVNGDNGNGENGDNGDNGNGENGNGG